jgi:hypothetical protein
VFSRVEYLNYFLKGKQGAKPARRQARQGVNPLQKMNSKTLLRQPEKPEQLI